MQRKNVFCLKDATDEMQKLPKHVFAERKDQSTECRSTQL
jgi:hypothetical protein